MVGVAVDSAEDSNALVQRLRLSFPILEDTGLAVAQAYGVAMKDRDIAIPALFVIDRSGNVAWRYIGETMADRPHSATIAEVLKKLGPR